MQVTECIDESIPGKSGHKVGADRVPDNCWAKSHRHSHTVDNLEMPNRQKKNVIIKPEYTKKNPMKHWGKCMPQVGIEPPTLEVKGKHTNHLHIETLKEN